MEFCYDIRTDNAMDCWKLRVAKGQSTPSAASLPSHKNVSPSEWDHAPQTSSQQQQMAVLANAFERSESDAVEELPATEDEGYCLYLLRIFQLFCSYNFS